MRIAMSEDEVKFYFLTGIVVYMATTSTQGGQGVGRNSAAEFENNFWNVRFVKGFYLANICQKYNILTIKQIKNLFQLDLLFFPDGLAFESLLELLCEGSPGQ